MYFSGLLLTIVSAKIYTSTDYGFALSSFSATIILSSLSTLRYELKIPSLHSSRLSSLYQYYGTLFLLSYSFLVFIACIITLSTLKLPITWLNTESALFLSAAIILTGCYQLSSASLIRDHSVKIISRIKLFQSSLAVLFYVFFFRQGWHIFYFSLVIAQSGGGILFLQRVVFRHMQKIISANPVSKLQTALKFWKKNIPHSLPSGASGLLSTLSSNITIILLPLLHPGSVELVGCLAFARSIHNGFVSLALGSLGQLLISRKTVVNVKVLTATFRILLVLALVVSAILILISHFSLPFLDSSWELLPRLFAINSIVFIMQFAVTPLSTLFYAMRLSGNELIAQCYLAFAKLSPVLLVLLPVTPMSLVLYFSIAGLLGYYFYYKLLRDKITYLDPSAV